MIVPDVGLYSPKGARFVGCALIEKSRLLLELRNRTWNPDAGQVGR